MHIMSYLPQVGQIANNLHTQKIILGGVNAAAAGTLTFMVGADTEEVFSTAETLLKDMGAKVI